MSVDQQPDTMSEPPAELWHVYLVRCRDGSLYTGIATDVERRLTEHRAGTRGAKYLRGRGPLELVLASAVGDRGHALRVEAKLKKLSRPRKEALIDGGGAPLAALIAASATAGAATAGDPE